MGSTQRFGLTTFSAPGEGSLSDDGHKFTGRDRRVLDRILASLEQHRHAGGERLETPAQGPTLELFETGGDLLAGQTLHYRVSYVDRHGLETAGSAEVAVAMPDPLAIPDQPMLEALDGGQLAEDLYSYALTAVDDDGNETPLGPSNLITITDRNTVKVTLATPPAGAAELHVWREMSGDAGPTRIGTMDPAVGEYTDDGTTDSDPCPCDPLKLPPLENETNSNNSVLVSIPTTEVELPTLIKRWRIYRSATSGVYPSDSLVEEVVDTVDETSDQLISEFLDTGTISPGQPLGRSQTLEPSQQLTSTTPGLADPVTLDDGAGTIYRLVADADGAIALEETELDQTTATAVLTDSSGAQWQVGLTTDLAVTTDPVSDVTTVDKAVVFAYGSGPFLDSPSDHFLTYMMSVDLNGALVTAQVYGGNDVIDGGTP